MNVKIKKFLFYFVLGFLVYILYFFVFKTNYYILERIDFLNNNYTHNLEIGNNKFIVLKKDNINGDELISFNNINIKLLKDILFTEQDNKRKLEILKEKLNEIKEEDLKKKYLNIFSYLNNNNIFYRLGLLNIIKSKDDYLMILFNKDNVKKIEIIISKYKIVKNYIYIMLKENRKQYSLYKCDIKLNKCAFYISTRKKKAFNKWKKIYLIKDF